jgi:hypothetical protein
MKLKVLIFSSSLCALQVESVLAQSQYQWENVTNTAAWMGRDGAGALVYDNKMWLLGGWNPGNATYFPKICNNEVWNSTDGATWNLIKANTFKDGVYNPATDWEGRHTAGYVVHNNKMWIVGGDANQGHYQSDVWNSSDGVSWTKVNNAVPWGPRVLHYTLVHNGKIWVMGGQTLPQLAPAPETWYNDVWNSTDGVTWNQVQIQGPSWIKHGAIGGSVVFNNRMWVIGGGTYWTPSASEVLYNDVWSSADGVNWTQSISNAPWASRKYHSIAVFDNKMWVFGGHGGASLGDLQDVWYSSDGANWTQLSSTPWLARHAQSVFVYNNALYLAAGDRMTRDVWRLSRVTPASTQWSSNSSGDWNDASKWSNGVPNAAGQSVLFSGMITSPQTIYANTPVTIGAMTFDSASSCMIAGQGSLTLEAINGAATLSVLRGSPRLNLPVFFASDSNVTVATGAVLTLSDPVTIRANKTVTRSGNVLFQAPLVLESGATLAIGPGAIPVLSSVPSLGEGAGIDVRDQAIRLMTGSDPSPVVQLLRTGYQQGAWDGEGFRTSLASASAGLGWIHDSQTQQVLIQFASYGDTDLNGIVDTIDFNSLAGSYGVNVGATWQQGDFNYDGKVSTLDFNHLAGNFGNTIALGSLSATLVPEPAGMMLAAFATGMLARRRSHS